MYENLDELKSDLADYIAELSEAAVKERGAFAIALSGGSDCSQPSSFHQRFSFGRGSCRRIHVCYTLASKNTTVSVSDISDCPKLDLILLGIGPEHHVASLCSNHSALNETDKWVTFIIDSPKPPPERITFTFPVIKPKLYI
ncbi:hypothetical protein Golob_003102 [Gossypium lobatum]|uniref:Glucosamine/galactosamine-6-phosphate isomerase domain-containing protein n=1 Tax=Gossypium lobatum TaxID=34289 RepID=A0A7J8N737_9ROSI|nr:hypothetical protein [Gossypium lobatum]